MVSDTSFRPCSYHFVIAVWRAKSRVFRPEIALTPFGHFRIIALALSLLGVSPKRELHLTLFPQGNRERRLVHTEPMN